MNGRIDTVIHKEDEQILLEILLDSGVVGGYLFGDVIPALDEDAVRRLPPLFAGHFLFLLGALPVLDAQDPIGHPHHNSLIIGLWTDTKHMARVNNLCRRDWNRTSKARMMEACPYGQGQAENGGRVVKVVNHFVVGGVVVLHMPGEMADTNTHTHTHTNTSYIIMS